MAMNETVKDFFPQSRICRNGLMAELSSDLALRYKASGIAVSGNAPKSVYRADRRMKREKSSKDPKSVLAPDVKSTIHVGPTS